MSINNNEHETMQLGDESNDKSRFIEAMNERSSSSNFDGSDSANTSCLTSKPDSTYGTYNSSDRDDTITDEDIALFLEDRPYSNTTSLPEICSHLKCVRPVPESGINVGAPCTVCNSTDENWMCLTCYQVYCSRYVNKHMVTHTQETNHTLTISLRDVSVWCYSCDDYVYNEVLEEPIRIILDAKYGSPADVFATADR